MDRYYKGMNTDSNPLDQPKGSYRYCLNGVIQTDDMVFISTEESNMQCDQIPITHTLVGHVYSGDNSFILFLTSTSNDSIIATLDKNCNYNEVVVSQCLGFNVKNQIQATYRVRLGCEPTVYFTDNLSPVRYFNLAKEEFFQTQAYKDYIEGGGNPETYPTEKWECSIFSLIPEYTIPCFSSAEILTTGILRPGSYNFAIQYLTEDLNPTNWIYDSQVINIFHDDLNQDYNAIEGSSVYSVDTLAGVVSNTNKAIKLILSDLDPRYTYYRIGAIQATSYTGDISNIYASPVTAITNNEFIYDGGLQGYEELSIEELVQPREDIEVAAHIEQLENRLILANTKGKQVNFCGFQTFASKISSKYVVKEVPVEEVAIHGNPKNPLTPFDSVGFMGGEVYAFGIVYIFEDGFESPVYHIPGTHIDERYNPDTQTCIVVDDSSVVNTWSSDIEHLIPATDEAAYNALPSNQKIPQWRIQETGVAIDSTNGYMAYHENLNTEYPKKQSCDGGDYWGTDACGNTLVNTPIRHHKFPSRELVPHMDQGAVGTSKVQLLLFVSLIDGELWPGDPQNITVDYDLNGIAQPQINTIVNEVDLDINGQVLITVDGDISDVTNIVLGGTIPGLTEVSSDVTINSLITTYRDTTIIRPLGIQFDNIDYPSSDIVGHYFVRAQRDNVNRTIIDKGISGRLRQKDLDPFDYTTFSYFTRSNNAPKDIYTFTPTFLFEGRTSIPDYLKIENAFNFQNKVLGADVYDGVGGFIKETDTIVEHRTQYYSGLTFVNSDENKSVNKGRVYDGLSYDDSYIGGRRFYNLSHTNKVLAYGTDSDFPYNGNDISYVSLRVDRNIHPSLEDVRYIRMHNCMLTNDVTTDIYGGDTYISHMNLSNTLFREFFQSPWGAIFVALGIIGGALAVIATAGLAGAGVAALLGVVGTAAFAPGIASAIIITAVVAAGIGVTAQAIRGITQAYAETNLDQLAEDSELDGLKTLFSSFVAYGNEHITGIYVESEINMGLRQTETHLCGEYYKYDKDISDYFREKILFFDETEEKFFPKSIVCPEIYHFNPDYKRLNSARGYFALPLSYDCCSDCLETHPTRVYYSQQSFQEEKTDNFRMFLPNNYRDIEAEHGVITNVFKRQNNLFIHSEEMLWQLPQNIQERVTDNVVSFIGTGEYFSIPPRKIVDASIGSLGSRHKWATLVLDIGVFFVNQLEGSVIYMSGDAPSKVSDNGMRTFFLENLKFSLTEQIYSLLGLEYEDNNPANTNWVGIHATYDTRLKRVLFTKRDYKILSDFTTNFAVLVEDEVTIARLYYNSVEDKWKYFNGVVTTEVSLDDPSYFENKSWTISYSMISKSWASFHSFIPNLYMFGNNTFYSFLAGNGIWKHDILGDYRTFYDTLYPHIFEYVDIADPRETVIWEDIQYNTVARRYNDTTKYYYDERFVTFDSIIVYNERQSSGKLLIVPKDENGDPIDYMVQQIQDIDQSILANRDERNWSINMLRDYVVDITQSLFTKQWDKLKLEFPIDKVVNENVIDYNKDWFELESMRDKYIVIRFGFNNEDSSIQLSTKYLGETINKSSR